MLYLRVALADCWRRRDLHTGANNPGPNCNNRPEPCGLRRVAYTFWPCWHNPDGLLFWERWMASSLFSILFSSIYWSSVKNHCNWKRRYFQIVRNHSANVPGCHSNKLMCPPQILDSQNAAVCGWASRILAGTWRRTKGGLWMELPHNFACSDLMDTRSDLAPANFTHPLVISSGCHSPHIISPHSQISNSSGKFVRHVRSLTLRN